jgi:hypothetical protein
MTASIELRGLDDVRSLIAALGEEMQSVNKYSQNTMVYQLWLSEKDQMRTDIDRPNPFSVGALRYKKFGEPGGPGAPAVEGAAVHFAVPFGTSEGLEEDEYLGVQGLGGKTAGPRASEVRLRQLGYLPDGYVWVPDPSVKLDRYGNVRGSVIQSMLADLKDGPRGANFFVLGYPKRPVGIFARIGAEWLPFLWFVSRRDYRAIFDFYGRADREVNARFETIWGEQVTKALKRL